MNKKLDRSANAFASKKYTVVLTEELDKLKKKVEDTRHHIYLHYSSYGVPYINGDVEITDFTTEDLKVEFEEKIREIKYDFKVKVTNAVEEAIINLGLEWNKLNWIEKRILGFNKFVNRFLEDEENWMPKNDISRYE